MPIPMSQADRLQLARVRPPPEYSKLIYSVYDAHNVPFPMPPAHSSCACGDSELSHLVPVPRSAEAGVDSVALHGIRNHTPEGRKVAPSPRDATFTKVRLASVEASLQRFEAALVGSPATPHPGYWFHLTLFGAGHGTASLLALGPVIEKWLLRGDTLPLLFLKLPLLPGHWNPSYLPRTAYTTSLRLAVSPNPPRVSAHFCG